MSNDRFKVGLPLLVFLLLSLAIAGVGYYVFQQQARQLKESAQRELATIADLKAEQLVRWRNERKGDAQAVSQDYFLESAVAQWFQEGSPPGERRQRILDRLTTLQRAYDYYDVELLDDQGALRLSTAAARPAVSGTTLDLAIEAMRTGAILFSDLHRAEEEPGQPIRLDLLAPLLDENGQAIGVLLFRIDPDRFLFPLIQSWPTPSASAETMLVERSGNDVLYLNELRHQKHTALAMRLPITEEHRASAIAARGQKEVFEGIDYRNVPVLAASRKIPDSPWIIVAEVDQQEVYAPIRKRTLLTAELTVVLIALAGVLTALWWREKSSRMVARDYQNRLERQALIQHFDYLAKYANDIIFLYDSDFRIVEMNDRALAAYGYTREELLGLHISELRTPSAAAEFDRHRQQLGERKELVYETQAQRKDKTVFPVEVSSRMIVTEGRTFYQSIIRDITERKQNEAVNALRMHLVQFALTHSLDELLEEALNETEKLTDSLIGFYHFVEEDQNSLTLQTWSTRTKAVFCKAEGKGLHYPIAEAGVWADCVRQGKAVIHNDFAALPNRKGLPEGHAQVIRELVVPVVRGKKLSAVLGVGNKPANYTEKDVETVSLIADLTGEIAHRKRAEEQLRAASLYARSLIEASPDPLVTINREGKITDVNKATEEVTGRNRSELIGTDFSDYFTNQEEAHEGYQQVFQKGFVIDYPLAIRHKDGRVTDVLYNASVYRDEAGEILGVFAAARDITARKQAEEEVRRLNAELEQRVEDRTAELRAANAELDSFAYAVSHDLRAPLRAMSGFSQALMEDYGDRLDGDARSYLDQINLASRQMSELIDGLLTLSRSTRGELNQEALDISARAELLLAELAAAEPARRVVWTVEPGVQAQGDATMIEIVMRNLIDNALKFTSKTPDATIRVYTRETKGQQCFCVSDNGAGFDMAHAGKLFQPFQRLHRQEEFPGIGIGLATVQRIVHRHGGTIWAESAPGQGATFCFTLHNPSLQGKETS